ncbi:hypothetical protein VTJ49DRAFT_7571 [Mycothermus thermophilus]|uniref:methionyl-tRNA formyltransferase n=1 Tax=Humicola insolens TaxID=85995 RepID=A0ABR3VGM3_HUMIN
MLLIINSARLASSFISQAKLWPRSVRSLPSRVTVAKRRSSIRPYSDSSASSSPPPASDPLRILFCGSDHFSCASLRALHEELRRGSSQDGGGLIHSIDVVVRPAKPTGRGYKVLREVPLRGLADELGLPVHLRDTFKGWDMPRPDGEPINLIIAVSFGLFVPPRLINASKYGGLNVHPSLLPDLRGPAPIHHAFLLGRSHTGVTIQTLSPVSFDAGVPLMQTPRPGIPVPNLLASNGDDKGGTDPLKDLHDQLAAEGARMLVETLKSGLHVPPWRSCLPEVDEQNRERLDFSSYAHAPKITTADKQLPLARYRALLPLAARATDPDDPSFAPAFPHGDRTVPTLAMAAERRFKVLGPLWSHVRVPRRPGGSKAGKKGAGKKVEEAASDDEGSSAVLETKRVILEDLRKEYVCYPPDVPYEGWVRWIIKRESESEEGGVVEDEFVGRYIPCPDKEALVELADYSWLRVGRIKVEGSTSKPALSVLESLRVTEEELNLPPIVRNT